MAESPFDAYGLEPSITPEQQFYRFSSQFAPTTRRAFYGQEDPLTARYMLRSPTYGGSFGQFLGGYGGGPPGGVPGSMAAGYAGGPAFTPYTGQELRQRAEAIAGIQSMSEPAFADYAGGGTYTGPYAAPLGTLTTPELAQYRTDYYTGGQGGVNARNLANLLALQRPGGGQYTGRLQEAMGNLINELYTQYVTQNPETEGNFLNWYLGASAPGGRLAPGAAPAAGG